MKKLCKLFGYALFFVSSSCVADDNVTLAAETTDPAENWDLIDYTYNSNTYENESLNTTIVVSEYPITSYSSYSLGDIAKTVSKDNQCLHPVYNEVDGSYIIECDGRLKIFVVSANRNLVDVAITDCNSVESCINVSNFIQHQKMSGRLVLSR